MDIKIIEPDGMFYEGKASFIEFTSVEGRMGVYKNHIPLTTILEPCDVKVHTEEGIKKAAVMGGFIEIQKEKATILAEDAAWPEEIDVERAKASKQRAQERIEKRDENLDLVRAEASLKRAIARISAAK